LLPSACSSGSEKLVHGTTHLLSGPSQRLQWGDALFRTFVTPRSTDFPLSAKAGDGNPQRALTSSRPAVPLRTIGADASGKTAGIGSAFPRLSLMAFANARMASAVLVIE
jgi:hypothetical protein